MNEFLWIKIKLLFQGLLFLLCLAVMILGQRSPGWAGLGQMLLGLAGMLLLLRAYNRKAELPAGKKSRKEDAF